MIDGNGKVLYGGLQFDAETDGSEGEYEVTIKNLTLDGNHIESGYGLSSKGAQDADTIRPVKLTLIDCTITNFSAKGLYMTNVQSLTLDGCTFEDNADMTDSGGKGDYALDLNLIGVQNVVVSITDCKFIDDCGHKAAVKITQRAAEISGSDDTAGDIHGDVAATISSVTLTNNTFSVSEMIPVDIMLGSRVSSGSGAKSYTSAFDVEVVSSGETHVARSTGVDQRMDITLSDGSKLVSEGAINKATDSLTGFSAFTLESGSAVISGYIPETASLSVAQGASATVGSEGLKSDGMIYTVNNNLSGNVVGKVQNTDVAVNPGYDDDEDLPPYIPSQSSNDDTVTIVACAAAAAVAAILAVFLVIDRKG